jgi:HEAT repeat protein
MKKILRRIGLLLLVVAFSTAIVKTVLVYGNLEPIKALLSKATPAKAPAVQAKIPDFHALATQGAAIEPSEAHLREEKQIESSQVATAGQWLISVDALQRHNGAEQLSAYPTPEAEKMLLTALRTDTDAKVRSTAAESLSAFESLSIPAILGLLAAMDDKNENVQFNAFSTLQNQVANEEGKTKRYQIIMQGLRKKAKSARLSEDMRNAVRGFIEDQQLS